MADHDNPFDAPQAPPTGPEHRRRAPNRDDDGLIAEAMEPLARRSGWMKFLAVLGLILLGLSVINAMTTTARVDGPGLVGAIIGITILGIAAWTMVLLFGAASAAQRAWRSNHLEDARQANVLLGRMFLIMGIYTIVVMALMLFVMIFAVGMVGWQS